MPKRNRFRNPDIPISQQLDNLISQGVLDIDLSNTDDVKPRTFLPVPSQEDIDEELRFRTYYRDKEMERRNEEINRLGGGDIIQWMIALDALAQDSIPVSA